MEAGERGEPGGSSGLSDWIRRAVRKRQRVGQCLLGQSGRDKERDIRSAGLSLRGLYGGGMAQQLHRRLTSFDDLSHENLGYTSECHCHRRVYACSRPTAA